MSHGPLGTDDGLPAFGSLVVLMLTVIVFLFVGLGIGVGLAWLKINLYGFPLLLRHWLYAL